MAAVAFWTRNTVTDEMRKFTVAEYRDVDPNFWVKVTGYKPASAAPETEDTKSPE